MTRKDKKNLIRLRGTYWCVSGPSFFKFCVWFSVFSSSSLLDTHTHTHTGDLKKRWRLICSSAFSSQFLVLKSQAVDNDKQHQRTPQPNTAKHSSTRAVNLFVIMRPNDVIDRNNHNYDIIVTQALNGIIARAFGETEGNPVGASAFAQATTESALDRDLRSIQREQDRVDVLYLNAYKICFQLARRKLTVTAALEENTIARRMLQERREREAAAREREADAQNMHEQQALALRAQRLQSRRRVRNNSSNQLPPAEDNEDLSHDVERMTLHNEELVYDDSDSEESESLSP